MRTELKDHEAGNDGDTKPQWEFRKDYHMEQSAVGPGDFVSFFSHHIASLHPLSYAGLCLSVPSPSDIITSALNEKRRKTLSKCAVGSVDSCSGQLKSFESERPLASANAISWRVTLG